jgi:hypothetical protein
MEDHEIEYADKLVADALAARRASTTFDLFMKNVNFRIQMNEHLGEDFRAGQLFMMELFEVRPDIAKQLAGSMLDPTFKHRITQVVQTFVKDRW